MMAIEFLFPLLIGSPVNAAAGRSAIVAVLGETERDLGAPRVSRRRLSTLLDRIAELNPALDTTARLLPANAITYPPGFKAAILPASITDLPMTDGPGRPGSIYMLTVLGPELPSSLQVRKFLSDARGPIDRALYLVLACERIPELTNERWGRFAAEFRRGVGLGDGSVLVLHTERLKVASVNLTLPGFVRDWFERRLTRRFFESPLEATFARRIDVRSGVPISVSEPAHVYGGRNLLECGACLDHYPGRIKTIGKSR